MDNPAAAANSVLDWIGKYGISTVFATIFLVFFLWERITSQRKLAEVIDTLNTTLVAMSKDFTALAAAQARQGEVLSEVVRALDRIQDRQERPS